MEKSWRIQLLRNNGHIYRSIYQPLVYLWYSPYQIDLSLKLVIFVCSRLLKPPMVPPIPRTHLLPRLFVNLPHPTSLLQRHKQGIIHQIQHSPGKQWPHSPRLNQYRIFLVNRLIELHYFQGSLLPKISQYLQD